MIIKEGEKSVKKNILAITDFAKSSADAVLFAAKLLNPGGKYSVGLSLKFKLLHVYENPDEKSSLLISVKDIVSKDSQTNLRRQSAEISSALAGSIDFGLLSISTLSVMGKLKKAIGDIVQSDKIDLIVAGIKSPAPVSGTLPNLPLLFMSKNRIPVILVPENCPAREVKDTLIINMDAPQQENSLYNEFEHIISHDHISKHLINAHENVHALKENRMEAISPHIPAAGKTDLLVINPAPGDNIDRAMLDYNIGELYKLTGKLLQK